MPVMDCQTEGRPGKKWGQSGKCYPCVRRGGRWNCENASTQAVRQGRVIQARQARERDQQGRG